jgi:hypothetical protein
MANENQIKREDVISEDALNWGKSYSKNIKKAIKLNKEFEKSIKKLRKTLSKL